MVSEYYQIVASKMRKTKAYQRSSFIKPYIPETVYLTRDNLEYMLGKYSKVVFKPNIGERGVFVGFIIKTEDPTLFNIHYITDTYEQLDIDQIIIFIKKIAPKKRFLLQKGIDLIQYNNNPVDVRVVVQKPYKKWLVTGYIARIAPDNMMVTNLDSGGTGMPFKQFLKHTDFDRSEIAKLKKTLRPLVKRIAKSMSKRYPNIRELGVDFGIDNNLYPWVLEVNTSPGYWRFKYFKDKSLYRRIKRYHQIIANSIKYPDVNKEYY